MKSQLSNPVVGSTGVISSLVVASVRLTCPTAGFDG